MKNPKAPPSQKLEITPCTLEDINKILVFTDKVIGTNYFSYEDLHQFLIKQKGILTSFLLRENSTSEIVGIRLTLPPGNWYNEINKFSFSKWKIPPREMGYFKAHFIDPKYQRQGWGQKLTSLSINALKNYGAKGIVCHCWKESPNNSSFLYLRKMGFEQIAIHHKFWFHIKYNCVRCGEPCLCSAIEMVKYLHY